MSIESHNKSLTAERIEHVDSLVSADQDAYSSRSPETLPPASWLCVSGSTPGIGRTANEPAEQ